jgi:phage major head subunit gpT-like protein
MKLMMKAGYRARYKQDDLLRAVISGGFATTTNWDGAYQFSATHSIGDTGLTQSNLVSGALSETTLNTAYTNLMTMKDHENLVMPIQGSVLLVPAALAKKAWELVNSPDGSETGDRKRNYVNSLGIKVVVWPLLDAVSTTAWYMLSDKMWHTLTCYQKVAPSMKMYTDEDTDNMWEKVRFVQVQGSCDYLGTQGSTGA